MNIGKMLRRSLKPSGVMISEVFSSSTASWNSDVWRAYGRAQKVANQVERTASGGWLDRNTVISSLAMPAIKSEKSFFGLGMGNTNRSYNRILICDNVALMDTSYQKKGEVRGFSLKFASPNSADATGYSWEDFGDCCEFPVEKSHV